MYLLIESYNNYKPWKIFAVEYQSYTLAVIYLGYKGKWNIFTAFGHGTDLDTPNFMNA